ncbi:MAG: DUF2605 domain-containing protein [Cyanobacteriota bacterium]|nr:DUF2605 domain-containing protein [Cyanobacteriota bacterium]
MVNPNPSESELLKTILEPLLDDFEYWFARSRKLLENEEISFLEPQQQSDFLARLTRAQQEVGATKMLVKATGTQAGVDMAVLLPWHQLLTECWKVALRFRSEQAQSLGPQNDR